MNNLIVFKNKKVEVLPQISKTGKYINTDNLSVSYK